MGAGLQSGPQDLWSPQAESSADRGSIDLYFTKACDMVNSTTSASQQANGEVHHVRDTSGLWYRLQ